MLSGARVAFDRMCGDLFRFIDRIPPPMAFEQKGFDRISALPALDHAGDFSSERALK